MAEDLTTTCKVTVVRDGMPEEVEDTIVREAPMTIFLNGEELITLLCTPEKLDRLALGFLRSEGLLQSREEVAHLRVRQEEGIVEVELHKGHDLAGRLFGRRTITSGCGKGTIFFSALDSLRSRPVTSRFTIDCTHILVLIRQLQERSRLYKATGGAHSAALADGEKILFFHEDIGRHNAVDKIVGECLLQEISFEDKLMILSGRLSSEILLKSAKLQLPLLVSRSAPTSLSLELAENLNITLVGFARGQRLNIYTHPWRVCGLRPGR